MFKNIVAPVQAWLLSQGKCVGCAQDLPRKEGPSLVRITCSCGRIYMYDPGSRKYRRARFDEVK